jgi:hypothetical protein
MSATPDDGTVLALGRRHRSAWDRFDDLDRRHAKMPPDAPDKALVGSHADRAEGEQLRLFNQVFARRCETLADAATMAAYGLLRAVNLLEIDLMTALQNGSLEERLGHLRWAFANILAVTSKAASLDLCQIGAPDLARCLNAALATRRA